MSPFVFLFVVVLGWTCALPIQAADHAQRQYEESPNTVMPTIGSPNLKPAHSDVDTTYKNVDTSSRVRRQPSVQRMKSLLEERDFDYGRHRILKRTDWWDRAMEWLQDHLFPRIDYRQGDMLLNIILYGSIIVALILLMWFWSSRASSSLVSGDALSVNTGVEMEDERLPEEDLRARIQEAVASGDFRRAIRYTFLAELRSLEREEILHLDSAKTNAHYAREISSAKGREVFRRLCAVYEWAWYGENDVKQAEFQAVQTELEHFRSQRSRSVGLHSTSTSSEGAA